MTSPNLNSAPQLRHNAAMCRFAADIIGVASRQSLWLILLDSKRRPLPTIIPIDHVPSDPHQYFETPAGAVQFPTAIANLMAAVTDDVGAESVLIVWERPSDDQLSQSEIDSVLAIDEQFALAGVPIAAQLLCHREGVRAISPEELEPDEILIALLEYAASVRSSL